MMDDLISRKAAIENVCDEVCRYFDAPPNLGYKIAEKAIEQLPSAQPEKRTNNRTEMHACDCISRQDAIDALWKALYDYEDKTEKQFQESEELDVSDWIVYRSFVQNMSDIDRQTILKLPTVTERAETLLDDGTLMLECDSDISKVTRVNVRQRGTHLGDLFYPDEEERTGHWIEGKTCYDAIECYCSECGQLLTMNKNVRKNFCPECGSYNGGGA